MKIRYDQNGIHFFNRNTGANLLVDEIIVPSENWSKSPRHVSFALTNICDLKCSYCYAPKNKDFLHFEKLKNWIKEIDLNGTLGVGFGGGEPSIYKDFVELCSFTSENTGLAVSFTTHGHRISPSMAKDLTGKVHFIRVSMDGLESTYERLRGRSFEKLKQKISLISTISPFGINYVLNSDTYADLENAIELSEKLGASEFLILPEINQGGNFSKIQLNNLKDFLKNYDRKLPLRINQNCAEGMPICDPFVDENSLCAYAFVDAKGVLKRTSYDLNGVDISDDKIMNGFQLIRSHFNQ